MANKNIDYYFGRGGSDSALPNEGGDCLLDRSPPSEPPRFSIWETFCNRACEMWKSNGLLFFTLTINSKMKVKTRYLLKMDPVKQAKYFKQLVKELMTDYNTITPIHYYIFFEYTKAGVIHCHGMAYGEDGEVILSYPYYATALKKMALKHQFMAQGIHCEPVKSFADVKKYISKDFGKHPVVPIYG